MRRPIIVAGCLHVSKARHEFFFLLQTEDGDVFKLQLEYEDHNRMFIPIRIVMKYYETWPVARAMVLIRKGYIYIAAEDGNDKLYHVTDLADDPECEKYNTFSSDGLGIPEKKFIKAEDSMDADLGVDYFWPRVLRYTQLAVDVPSLNPLIRTKVDNPLNEDAPQIYAIQGTGRRSAFKTIRHGLDVHKIVSSPLGATHYDRLWSMKHRAADPYHTYLLLSSTYADKTVVLQISDTIEEVEDTKFHTSRATIEARQMGEDSLVQVHARGVRTVMPSGKINDWNTPIHRTAVSASANQWQLLLGLSSAELVYFVFENGALHALEEMPEMSGTVTALSVSQTREGQQLSKYAVVGCDDCTIRVLSLEVDSPLEVRSVQALSAAPTSIELVDQLDPESGTMLSYAHIGLASGLYLRAVIDDYSGDLGEVRTKFLGARPTRVFPVEVDDDPRAVLACSTRPWLSYNHPVTGMHTLTPLVTKMMTAGVPFVSEHFGGLCALQGEELL